MPSSAAVSSPEPDDLRRRGFPRLVPGGEEASPATEDEPRLGPPGLAPPGAVATSELPWDVPRPRGVRRPPLAAPHWRMLQVAAGAAVPLFLLLLLLLWMGLLALRPT